MKKSAPKTTSPTEKKREERGLRTYFIRLFGKYDIRNERKFVTFGKWLIFIILVCVEALLLLGHINDFPKSGGWKTLGAILILSGALTLSQTLKLFVFKGNAIKMGFYVLDTLAACGFTFLTDGTYPLVLFMLILTEFYITAEKSKPSFILLCASTPLYVAAQVVQSYILLGGGDILMLVAQSFGSVFALVVHFLVVQVALAFYRQFLRLDRALGELKESKKELEKAYAVVAEVTALEERQRIAKEIHDTAGHSITTVIMQTEAAKLIIDKNPSEAKSKLIAANLQAKHALEELRDSVHLLSGSNAGDTLKAALEDIIHESTDGTGITIRSEIEDTQVSSAKYRFLCNTLKEGISNGLRHGGATAFWFELKREGNEIRFFLSDNGKGVKTDELALGFGLTSMKERARSFGGEVRVSSEAGEGFELRLSLPADHSRFETADD
ncbi:MAG: sensor histidine kinase [Clostridia bacterium]|nr:sensor histidine kinase [Clostridia bacterium]